MTYEKPGMNDKAPNSHLETRHWNNSRKGKMPRLGRVTSNVLHHCGNGKILYDKNATQTTTQTNGNYITIGFRELPY